jgi:hypothetical protein
MDNEEGHMQAEFVAVSDEISAMLGRWKDRAADPMIVCTVMITHLVSLAGHVIDDEERYEEFLRAVVKKGKDRYQEDRSRSSYVN